MTEDVIISEKDGKLTAICKEYASVGAGEFSVVLTLT